MSTKDFEGRLWGGGGDGWAERRAAPSVRKSELTAAVVFDARNN